MPDFPHLNLRQKLDGRYKFAKRRIEKIPEQQTVNNLANRSGHGAQLSASAQTILNDHAAFLQQRAEAGLPVTFDENAVPLFLQVDPGEFDIEALKGMGIEIVAEEEDGFIIGANTDNFRSLTEKINQFVNEQGQSRDQAAKLWQLIHGTQWRVDYILSESLREKYIAGIADTDQFVVQLSIACYLKEPERPVKREKETDEKYAEAKARHDDKVRRGIHNRRMRRQRTEEPDANYERRLVGWRERMEEAAIERDAIAMRRQDFLEDFIVNRYGGEILSPFIDLTDSFGFTARMSGQALKDVVRGYPYVFEISETDQPGDNEPVEELDSPDEVDIIAPNADAPLIGVIDSGMQEQHILLEPAIVHSESRNYVPHENTTADLVTEGGHGTKVAGAVLYGNNIPVNGTHQVICFIANARILDSSNMLPPSLYPPALMKTIADDYPAIRIYNMSVASRVACRTVHISAWAAMLDKLMHERKLLFVLAAGNIGRDTGNAQMPGVADHLRGGKAYPDYLMEPGSRVANPAQSLLALTVGSVCVDEFEDADRASFGKKDYVSAFSRSGPGMWGCIKPDVVEYGGDYLREKNGYLITQHDSTSAHVVKTGANRSGYAIGTSFAAPKVAHLIAQLAKKFPNDSVLLYKALVVQSARLPEHVFHQPTTAALRVLGYGLPDQGRALQNTPYRITFVAEGAVAAQQANLYSITIPQALRRAGQNFDVMIEITLTYTAIPRRTRRRLKSYFGTWLTWETSKLGENFQQFSMRVLKNMEEPEEETVDASSIPWTISTAANYGRIGDLKRQDSATQKDWTIVKSNMLTEELSFAVVGHKGWDKDTVREMPFALAISFEAISQQNEIYSLIEVANRVEVESEVTIPVSSL